MSWWLGIVQLHIKDDSAVYFAELLLTLLLLCVMLA